MTYAYDKSYDPAFPVLEVVLKNVEEDRQTESVSAFVDTGSDGTLVPISLLRDILAPPFSNTRIRSHWGEWRTVQLYVMDLVIDGITLPGVFAVGDEFGEEVVLERDVLNKLRIRLDGPRQTLDVLTR